MPGQRLDAAARLGDAGDAGRPVAARDVELNEEGFFLDPEQWTEDMAPELAAREGIDELTDRHWVVLRFIADTGAGFYTGQASVDLFGLDKDDFMKSPWTLCDRQKRAMVRRGTGSSNRRSRTAGESGTGGRTDSSGSSVVPTPAATI